MSITGIPGIAPLPPSSVGEAAAPRGTTNFSEAVANAIGGLEQTQAAANTEAERLARGEGNLHEAALALEKADISMRLMVKARNKIVEAYQEIMRMPV